LESGEDQDDAGGKVTGGTVFAATDPSTYCAMANAGYDFIWTEHQHSPRDWEETGRMWSACPHAKAVPGVRVAYTDERENNMRWIPAPWCWWWPTVRSYEEASGRVTGLLPPLGRRSSGGGLAASAEFWGGVPGGYRQTINDNLVLILMIETLAGLKDADRIAKIPGVTAVFAASGDLGNHSGYKQGDPDYEREINIVHERRHQSRCAAVRAAGMARPCGLHLLPGGQRNGGYRRPAMKQDLGNLANTQGVPEVGPYAKK